MPNYDIIPLATDLLDYTNTNGSRPALMVRPD